jgi:hypothetical protein
MVCKYCQYAYKGTTTKFGGKNEDGSIHLNPTTIDALVCEKLDKAVSDDFYCALFTLKNNYKNTELRFLKYKTPFRYIGVNNINIYWRGEEIIDLETNKRKILVYETEEKIEQQRPLLLENNDTLVIIAWDIVDN